jgi:hypothetical protein
MLFSNFIFINFSDKWIRIDPSKIQIDNFKFPNISDDKFAVCLIKDKNGNKGVALLSGKIVTKINNGLLWDYKDPNIYSLTMYDDEDEDDEDGEEDHEYEYDSSKFSPSEILDISLKSICPDTIFCMAIGKKLKRIKQYFDGFVNFEYIKSPVMKIDKESTNGFVKEITYERDGYEANAILKSSKKPSSDNLIYEYLVGQYINKKCRVFPCFVETYGWYQYNTETTWKYINNDEEIDGDVLKSGLALTRGNVNDIDYLLKVACEKSKYLAILIQDIKNADTLESMITLDTKKRSEISNYTNFTYYDLMNVLYQIYMPLSTLAKEFTHYDLHTKNILIYEPVKGKYIDYTYIYKNGDIVEFKCRYIAKIIDYGRCFFKDNCNSKITGYSKLIYQSICNIPECDTDCGENKGFSHFNNKYNSINSLDPNITHDLLLLYRVKKLLNLPVYSKTHYGKFRETNDSLKLIFEKLNYYGNEEALEKEEALEQKETLTKAFEEALEQEETLTKALKKSFGEAVKKALEEEKDVDEAIRKVLDDIEDTTTIEPPVKEALERACSNSLIKALDTKLLKFEYGSPEKLSDGLKINNVNDLHEELRKLIGRSTYHPTTYMAGRDKIPYTSLGTLTIYECGIPMKFVPTPSPS